MKNEFSFFAEVWLYEGSAAWHFVTLPKETSKEIDYYFGMAKKGWGSLPVKVTMSSTTWETSIFPDKKVESYLLPIKAEVRKKEHVNVGDTLKLAIQVLAKI